MRICRSGGEALNQRKRIENSSDDIYFTELLQQYEKLVFSICYRMTKNYFDAEDLTQETFLSLYKALNTFDREHPSAYITRIATNKCLDYLKRAERRTEAAEQEELERLEQGSDYRQQSPEPEKLLLEKELHKELERCCQLLKPPYDTVAYQYYCRGSTAAQIAEVTGKKVKTIQTQLRRAKEMMQKYFRKEELV